MRYFYRLFEGVPNVPLMNSIMGHHEIFGEAPQGGSVAVLRNGADLPAMAQLTSAKKFALTIMQLVDGTALGPVILHQIEANGSKELLDAMPDYTRFIAVLHGDDGCSYLCEDESVPLRTGSAWRVGAGGRAINRSGDDLILMTIDIKVD